MRAKAITQVLPLARLILTRAMAFDWTVQGMGMMVCRPDPTTRIHIWDSRLRVPNVSMVHDHLQWSLSSMIVAGRLINQRYEQTYQTLTKDGGWQAFQYRTLRAGQGCHFVDEGPVPVMLRAFPEEHYEPGNVYFQEAAEIHETKAEDGTVTVMTKFPSDVDLARVFWPKDKEWVSAEPRPATMQEVIETTRFALHRWMDWNCPDCTPDQTCHGNPGTLCHRVPVERKAFGVKHPTTEGRAV